jgi:hypothetical protein
MPPVTFSYYIGSMQEAVDFARVYERLANAHISKRYEERDRNSLVAAILDVKNVYKPSSIEEWTELTEDWLKEDDEPVTYDFSTEHRTYGV